MVEIKNLHTQWDSLSIDFSALIEENSMFVITGVSGSGKSTVLRMISGLLPAGKNAEILLNGENVALKKPGRRKIGMVFQTPALFRHMRVIDNASYALAARGVSRKERHRIASEWLEHFELAGFERRWPDSLSGGEAQRVAIVRTLIAEPDLVLFDEPFSALDLPLRQKLGSLLREWQKSYHFTGILITHDLNEAKNLGDKITVMRHGQQIWTGLPSDFSEERL